MARDGAVGGRGPDVALGYLADGVIKSVRTPELFAGKKSIVIGVPGAFTPVCTNEHVPDFVRHADEFRSSGYQQLLCIAPNDPFVISAWSLVIDPERKLRFLADGN